METSGSKPETMETSGSEPFLWTREEWDKKMEEKAEGEKFLTPLPAASMQDDDRIKIPTGKWKDGLCDCLFVCWILPSFTLLCLLLSKIFVGPDHDSNVTHMAW
jgi:hypothetical protein